jgi:hypothetical protein
MKVGRLVPTPEVSRFLASLGEAWIVEAGSEVLSTPDGPLQPLARVLLGGERVTLLSAGPEVGTAGYARRLAHLVLGPLCGDTLLFLDELGRTVETPLRALSRPGVRRRFHFSLVLAEGAGRLQDASSIEEVMSEALGREVRCNPTGLNALDDEMMALARAQPEMPTLPAAARALGLFLGASLMLPGGSRILEEGLPVFEFQTRTGPLRLRAGEVAREVLLRPEGGGMLADAARTLGLLARDPSAFPTEAMLAWIEWATPAGSAPDGEGREAAEMARGRRLALMDRGELEDLPELSRIWKCAGCGRLHQEVQVLPASGLFLERDRLAARRLVAASSRQVPCRCGGMLAQTSLQHAMFARFLDWPGVDLRIELQRWPDGRLVESWSLNEPAGASRSLPGRPSVEALHGVLGRRDSLSSLWLELLARASRSGQAEAAPAGELTWLVALPGGVPEATAHRLEELLAPIRGWTTRSVSIVGENSEVNSSFRTWAGEFSARLEGGRMGGLALVDWPGYVERVRQALGAEGLVHEPDDQCPERLLLHEHHSWAALDLARTLEEGIRIGLHPEEVAVGSVRRARHTLHEVRAAADLAEKLVPQGEVEVEPRRRRLCVRHPGGDLVELSLDAVLASPEGAERSLRFHLGPESTSLETCRCGAPAHLAVKVRGASWLSGLPAGRAQSLARRSIPGPAQVLVRECPDHLVYLDWSDLERHGVAREDLESLLERDLDRTGGCFQVLALADTTHWAVAFVGRDAASLACHPGLLAGVCEAASLGIPERVEVAAPDVNLLVAGQPGIPAPLLARLGETALRRLKEGPGAGGEVGWICCLDRSAPRGRFLIEGIEDLRV